MTPVSHAELDNLSGELLLPKIALSLLGNSPLVNVSNTTNNYSAQGSQGAAGGGGQSVVDACSATTNQGGSPLLAALGLVPGPSTTVTCVPAAVTQGRG
jgi:hypothetical protein